MVFLALLGITSGIISSLFGLGGGIILIPSLSLLGYTITDSIGLSIMQMVFVSILGTLLNLRKKLIPIQIGLLLGIGGMIGSSFSGWILQHTSPKTLSCVFLGFLCFSFYKYFFSKTITYTPKNLSPFQKIMVLIPTGCLVGIFSSSLGVGGALLLIPICRYFFALNAKEVAPLGLLFICFSSFSGAISLYQSGFIHPQKGLILACFSMLGVVSGNYFLQKISIQNHKKILAVLYLFSILTITFKILNF